MSISRWCSPSSLGSHIMLNPPAMRLKVRWRSSQCSTRGRLRFRGRQISWAIVADGANGEKHAIGLLTEGEVAPYPVGSHRTEVRDFSRPTARVEMTAMVDGLANSAYFGHPYRR
jgi:hypothetical protein